MLPCRTSGEEAVGEKRQPLSLEELVAKRTAEQTAEAKPVFLSKEERAALAMKRRAEQVEAQAKARQQLSQSRFSQDAVDRDRRKMNDEVVLSLLVVDHCVIVCAVQEREKWYKEREMGKDKDREMDAIKSRYLGAEKKRRKLRRLADRKFVFDWDAGDDTSVDFNPM